MKSKFVKPTKETEEPKPKRFLVKLIIQPLWVEIDADGNVIELASNPTPVAPKNAQAYLDQLLEFAEKAKRGEIKFSSTGEVVGQPDAEVK